MLRENIHIAVPTAFFKDETLNTQGTISHIRNLYTQGVKSVLVSGTTGEQHSLSLQEKIAIINALELEDELMNNMEIIFGVSSVRQKEAEELAKKIRHTKLSGIMLGYSPYIIPTQEEALIYSKSIIELSNKPTILYNNPKRTGFNLATESIIELSKLDFVIGIKDAGNGNQEKIEKITNSLPKNRLHFYAGGEVDLKEKVAYGYNRLSSIAGNISPMEISQWFEKIVNQEGISNQESEKIESILCQVYQGNAITNVKSYINHNSIPIGPCRKPIGNINLI